MNHASPGRKSLALAFVFCARAMGVVLLVFSSFVSSFGASSIIGLGPYFRADAVSADGKVVVGNRDGEIWRWTAASGRTECIGKSPDYRVVEVNGVSADGSVVVGQLFGRLSKARREVTADGHVIIYEPANEAFRWTAAGGFVTLGHFRKDHPSSSARAVSGDGSVVVGLSSSDKPGGAFRWTAAGGMVNLGVPPGGYDSSYAFGVSSDGSTVVGRINSSSDCQAFRWSSASGMVCLGKLPSKKTADGSVEARSLSRTRGSCAYGITADGSVVVGLSENQACSWKADGSMVKLGRLRGSRSCVATAVSDDGSVIVGLATLPNSWLSFLFPDDVSPPIVPFIWDSVNGMRGPKSVLTKDYHLDLSGWKLTCITGIPADGKTIVGAGEHNGHAEAWIAHLDRR